MTKFRFRLERLLDLRSRKERQQAETLGRALRDETASREALEQAQERLGAAREQAAPEPGHVTSAGTLRNLGLTVAAAMTRRDAAAVSQGEAEQALDAERERYEAAQRDRRVIERLREKRLEDWTRETGRKEQQEMDGLALDRHRRQQEERL
jgi:flagellar protein FliJ